jgi:hypothetical protein
MSMLRKLGLAALVVVCSPWSFSQAGVYVGIGVPGPYYYRPYYRPWYGGVYVAPPPVVVGAAPVVVQQPVVVAQPVGAQPAYSPSSSPPAQAPAPTSAPAPAPLPPPEPVSAAATPSTPAVMPAMATGTVDLDSCLQQLRSGDEPTRAAALVSLGKLRLERAVGPMVKTLNSDPSPRVREAAARGLGLVASPSALSALQYAAQADDDPEVRRSASFAAEVIRGNFRR